MHVAAREVEPKGRAHEARCKVGRTHSFHKAMVRSQSAGVFVKRPWLPLSSSLLGIEMKLRREAGKEIGLSLISLGTFGFQDSMCL